MKRTKKSKFAKKSLGQNFLHSPEIRQRIVDVAGDINGKNILEIGPGLGFLTTKLLAAGANITAVELDKRACEVLKRDFGHKDHFKLIQGDILKQDLDTIFEQETCPRPRSGKYSIIANIPYNITAPILRKILSQTKNRPQFAILMVQKEVAEKICNLNAKSRDCNNPGIDCTPPTPPLTCLAETWRTPPPRGRTVIFKRSILSISVEVFAEAEISFAVGREHFSPSPRVDSAVIKLTTRQKPLVSPKDEKDFFTVVNAGFSQKRKKLKNFLGGFFGVSSEILLGSIDGTRRAETLTVKEWMVITKNFQTQVK